MNAPLLLAMLLAAAAPPAPERLSSVQVERIVASKEIFVRVCLDEQKRREPKRHGAMVLRFSILPSGATADVAIVTKDSAKTYAAQCIADAARKWTFPPHRVQGLPVERPIGF